MGSRRSSTSHAFWSSLWCPIGFGIIWINYREYPRDSWNCVEFNLCIRAWSGSESIHPYSFSTHIQTPIVGFGIGPLLGISGGCIALAQCGSDGCKCVGTSRFPSFAESSCDQTGHFAVLLSHLHRPLLYLLLRPLDSSRRIQRRQCCLVSLLGEIIVLTPLTDSSHASRYRILWSIIKYGERMRAYIDVGFSTATDN